MQHDKIYLVGFMGAGKTTLAAALAKRLGWGVEDVDRLIEARESLAVAEIFARFGEPYFRDVEREIVQLLLPLRRVVVATGGGTFVDPANRVAINRDGLSIWIDVPFDLVLARIPPDGSRPLSADAGQIARLYEARRAAYLDAHMRLDAGDMSVTMLVDRILDRLATLRPGLCDI